MKYIGDIIYNLPVHFFPLWKMSELLYDKSNKMTCSSSEYSDKPGHPPNLIPVITVRMKKCLCPIIHNYALLKHLTCENLFTVAN